MLCESKEIVLICESKMIALVCESKIIDLKCERVVKMLYISTNEMCRNSIAVGKRVMM